MIHPSRLFTVSLACIATAVSSGVAVENLHSQPPKREAQIAPSSTDAMASTSATHSEGVVVLVNQNVLRGKVTRDGEFYYVSNEHGELRLAAGQVEMAVASLDEAYQRKRERIAMGDAEGRLRLAAWCLRNHMVGYAAEEILAARGLDPRDPRIAQLERQMDMATSPPTEPLPPAGQADDRPTRDQLDKIIRELPREAVSSFAARIQPLVVNRCGLAGCHGPGAESDFRLERLPTARNFGNRLTQRNLYAVLQQIDRQSPGDSPLVAKPLTAHGDLARPVFAPHELDQLEQLTAWAFAVTQPPANPQPPTLARFAAPVAPPGGQASADQLLPIVSPAGIQAAFADQPPSGVLMPTASLTSGASGVVPATTSPSSSPPTPSPAPPGYIGRDPFDPELFNRANGPER
jgi:hypothetical protein